MNETYLNHPTFGLLFSICPVGRTQGLFTTLYAQRLFFRVSVNPAPNEAVVFEPVSRKEARQILEEEIRTRRRQGEVEAMSVLQQHFKAMFV
jgi:PII interaction protein X